jgi:hypothetical protein
MGGVAGEFAKIYSEHLESPPEFFYMSFLTCLGSLIADSAGILSEVRQEPRLYLLLLGESADDRKSTSLMKTIGFFKEAIQDFGVCYGVGSAEGLQKRQHENPKLLLCLDEFKQFVSKCKIESSVLLPCVTTLFESNRYESATKKGSIAIENGRLSILAASTLQTYETIWDTQFTDIGFNNRLFIVPGKGERKHSFPDPIPDYQKIGLKNHLKDILQSLGPRAYLDIASDARAVYHDWYMNQKRSIHSKRLEVYAMRLMILLAVNAGKSEIDLDTVEKALALVNWQHEVRQIFDPIDADNEIARMEEKMRRQLKKGRKTERELRNSTNAQRKGLWLFRTALENLQDAGEVFCGKDKRYEFVD